MLVHLAMILGTVMASSSPPMGYDNPRHSSGMLEACTGACSLAANRYNHFPTFDSNVQGVNLDAIAARSQTPLLGVGGERITLEVLVDGRARNPAVIESPRAMTTLISSGRLQHN